jgi:hypothetical protein
MIVPHLLLVPHLLVPHLLWVVVSLLCGAASGRLLAASLAEDDPWAQPLWLSAVAFVMWCCVCVLAIWWTA